MVIIRLSVKVSTNCRTVVAEGVWSAGQCARVRMVDILGAFGKSRYRVQVGNLSYIFISLVILKSSLYLSCFCSERRRVMGTAGTRVTSTAGTTTTYRPCAAGTRTSPRLTRAAPASVLPPGTRARRTEQDASGKILL